MTAVGLEADTSTAGVLRMGDPAAADAHEADLAGPASTHEPRAGSSGGAVPPAHLARGVVMVCGADGGVGWPDAVVAVAVTSYVVPGARPVSVQSYGTAHVTVMGVPPPMGVAVRV